MEFKNEVAVIQQKATQTNVGIIRRQAILNELNLKQGQTILDIGCGGGHLLKEISFCSLIDSFSLDVAFPVGAARPTFKKLSIFKEYNIKFIIKVVLPVPGPPCKKTRFELSKIFFI